MDGLAKIAADSSLVQDFMAGVDPTGVRTFNYGMNNEEKHNQHRLANIAGGFTGGALIGTLAPAGLMGATALGMRKFNPGLADEFSTMAKGTMDALNPEALSRHVRAIKPLTEFKNKGSNFLDETKRLSNMADEIGHGRIPNADQLKEGYNIAKGFRGKQKDLQNVEDELSKKYYKGKPVGEGGARSFTALSTAGAGALSGALGATSASMQYNTGQRVKEMNEQNKLKVQ